MPRCSNFANLLAKVQKIESNAKEKREFFILHCRVQGKDFEAYLALTLQKWLKTYFFTKKS